MHYDYKKMPETADKKIVETWMAEQFEKQEVLEYHTMLENLKVLDQWCEVNDEKEFFKYFQDAVIGARCRALHYKNLVWTAKHESKSAEPAKEEKWWEKTPGVVMAGAPFILPILTILMGFVEKVEIDMTQFLAAVAVGAGISIPLGILKRREQTKDETARAVAEEEAKHKYDETWIRHTLCDSRLRLALSKFAASANPTKEDYDILVKSTFEILEQNLDQFAVNMCPNGMASR